ncbi:MAG: efflux RND transporter periplasmic adaptor subunit [Alphaproteobacteria bacterium]|nr:efflux RND transporter periplasmic adaptor subunit [Alphaproteobacteria bacterium]MDA8003633.1 efflux RND transporter periplasmic adaptor subunit [Alphaproteobacteria bacterium]
MAFVKSPRTIAVAVIAAAGLWIYSGTVARQGQPVTPQVAPVVIQDAEVTALEVRVETLTARPHVGVLEVAGRTEARRDLRLQSEISGRVEEILVEAGDAVAGGTALLRLTEQDRPATLADARAQLDQAESDFKATRRLYDEGLRSEMQLNAATATLASARAQLERATLELRRLVIDAPFGAVLEDVLVEVGDYVSPGSEVARLLDLDPLKLTFSVSEDELGQVRLGDRVEAELVFGGVVTGEVSFISRIADPATRTFRIEAEAANPDGVYPAGATARVLLRQEPRALHRISPGIIVLNDSGVLGVYGVDDSDTARFHSIEIVDQDAGGAWVSGMPGELRVVTVGQSWIQDGQLVKVVTQEEVDAVVDGG